MKENKIDEFIKNPKKALFTLALPIIIAMFVQTMYNIADTAFVGRLGAEAIAALTFSFPIFFVLIALNSGIGIGINSRISRLLGAKNKKEAENTASHGLLISFLFAFIIFLIGIATLKPLFVLFGAAEPVLELSIGYMSIILLGVFFMFPAYVVNSIFSSQGNTKTPMKIQISALVLNIILDPIFIYVLGLGVRGAAIATVISLMLSFILSVYCIKTKSYLKPSFSSFKFSLAICKEIFAVGAPASLMMLLMSIYVIFINRFMAHFGIEYVASFGIASKLESIAVMPIIALSIAILTIAGMFYGAKRNDLLKGITWYGLKISIFFTSAMGLLFFIFPSLFLRIFTSDMVLLNIGSAYLRIDVFTFPLMAVAMMTSRVMQGMGFGIPGLIINLVRVVIVAIPLAYFFVFVLGYGYLSIAVAMVIGGIVSNIIAIVWLRMKLSKLNVD